MSFIRPRRSNAISGRASTHGSDDIRDKAQNDLHVTSIGTGPRILLVHGWEGAGHDMEAIGKALTNAGFTCVIPDLPAHGASPGEHVTVPELAKALVDLQQTHGPFVGTVAHSVGCAATMLALTRGLALRNAVFISSPLRYLHFVASFTGALGLDQPERDAVIAELDKLGAETSSVDATIIGRQVTETNVTFVHSQDDRVVPHDHGQQAAQAFPGAKFLSVTGLGHGQILSDPEVLSYTVEQLIESEASG